MSADVPADPTPSRCRVALNSVSRCRSEMSKLYRLARSKQMPISDVTKLVFVLDKIAHLIVDEEIESRIEALENLAEQQPTDRQPYGHH